MKKYLLSATVLCSLTIALISCKKDSNSSNSKLKILTSGSWTLQDYQKKNSQGTWVSENDPFIQHYTITFYTNHTYAEQGNGTVVSWESNADFTQLTLANGTDAFGTFNVITCTSTALQLENTNPASAELYIYTH